MLGVEIEECRRELGTGDAVHRGVVHLRHRGDHAALEAFDDGHLPRRSPRVERPADHVGCELLQFGDPAGGTQQDPMEMRIEIEIRVLDPPGTMQMCGHLHESSTKWRNQVEAILHESAHLAE